MLFSTRSAYEEPGRKTVGVCEEDGNTASSQASYCRAMESTGAHDRGRSEKLVPNRLTRVQNWSEDRERIVPTCVVIMQASFVPSTHSLYLVIDPAQPIVLSRGAGLARDVHWTCIAFSCTPFSLHSVYMLYIKQGK